MKCSYWGKPNHIKYPVTFGSWKQYEQLDQKTIDRKAGVAGREAKRKPAAIRDCLVYLQQLS